jgi:hypothetical protein
MPEVAAVPRDLVPPPKKKQTWSSKTHRENYLHYWHQLFTGQSVQASSSSGFVRAQQRSVTLQELMMICAASFTSVLCKLSVHDYWSKKQITQTNYAARGWLATCFMLVSCLADSLTSKMEVTCSSETSLEFQRTTQHYFPDHRTLHNHRCENLKPYVCAYMLLVI